MSRNTIGDIILSFAAFFQIAVLMFKELLVAAQIVEHELFRLVGITLAALPMVPAIYYIIQRKLVLTISSYLLVLFIVVSTLIFFTENEQYFISNAFNESGLFYLLCINIPSFLCIASIRDIANLKRVMLLISQIIFLLGIFYFYFLWIGDIEFMKYSMTFSYYMLLPALVFVSQRKLLYTILFIIICIMMLLLGSRGALVAALMFVFFLFFIDKKSRRLIVPSVIFMVLVFSSFLSLLFTISSSTGISSRTLGMIQNGNLVESSGRDWIYTTIWHSIMDSPIWGHGIFGDRVVLIGDYSHNIFLEMLHNFGFLLGTALIILMILITIRVYFKSNYENRKLLLLFYCYSILPLLASASYLEDPRFGMFIGSLFILSKSSSDD